MKSIRLTAFRWVPPASQGQVRDLAVRWALEEAGLPYVENLLDPGANHLPAYRAQNPFGKVPVYEEDGLVLFESGAIVLHIADKSAVLTPEDPVERARAQSWFVAALNSVDPPIGNLGDIDRDHAHEAWARERRPAVLAQVQDCLRRVAAHLERRDYLAGTFSFADIMMVMVLRELRHTSVVSEIPFLREYRDRCEARPAFQRALAAQLAPFAKFAPAA